MTDASNGTTDNSESKALISKPSMGALAAQQTPEELDALVAQRRDVLDRLRTDSGMPENVRKAVSILFELASPNRPGLEEVNTAWRIPRMAIAQPTTRSEAKPEAAKNGDLYTTDGQLLERPYPFTVLYMHEENINFGDNNKNPICQAPDAKLGSPFGECLRCKFLPFGKQNGGRGQQAPTQCQNHGVATVLSDSLDNPAVYTVQFGKTSRKTGSALLALVNQRPRVWQQRYLLNTEKQQNDVGLYWIYKVAATGKDNVEPVQRLAEALYGLFIAERKRFLASWYLRPAKASSAAAEAEADFDHAAAEAGLLPTGAGEEPDLSTPEKPEKPSTPTSPGKGARTANKPM